jgi:bifunctional DNA-binding transcriptional regulator/antitoxin component of YhaV-PrlF toxin-antitoxin module
VRTIVKIQIGTDGYMFATIPKTIAYGKGWKKGDTLTFLIYDGESKLQGGEIIIRKVKSTKTLSKAEQKEKATKKPNKKKQKVEPIKKSNKKKEKAEPAKSKITWIHRYN